MLPAPQANTQQEQQQPLQQLQFQSVQLAVPTSRGGFPPLPPQHKPATLDIAPSSTAPQYNAVQLAGQQQQLLQQNSAVVQVVGALATAVPAASLQPAFQQEQQQQLDKQMAAAALATAAAAAAQQHQYSNYMQYDPTQYVAATAAGFTAGYIGGSAAAAAAYAYPAGYYDPATAAIGAYGYANGGSGSYYNAGAGISSRGGGRSNRGRGRGNRRGTSSEPGSELDDDAHAAQHQQGNASKRQRKSESEDPPLDAESQLLLIGFLSAVVGDTAMLEQCLITAAGLEAQHEQQAGGASEGGNGMKKRMGVLKCYQLAQSLATNVQTRESISQVWNLQLTFTDARNALALGGVRSVEDVVHTCFEEVTAAMANFNFEAAQLRKSTVATQVAVLVEMLQHTMEQLLTEAGHIPDKLVLSKPLPKCIVDNKEPFAHKEWRKEPYEPRPYTELTDYAITTNVPAEAKLLKWRLTTRRRDGAGDGFREKHMDMSPEQLAEKEQHLVQQVLHRQALKNGVDVTEVDCWGMDCYTRRNVFDAVLEAGVFKNAGNSTKQTASRHRHHRQQSAEQLQQQQCCNRHSPQPEQQQQHSSPEQQQESAKQQQRSSSTSPVQPVEPPQQQHQADHQQQPDQQQQRQPPDIAMQDAAGASAEGSDSAAGDDSDAAAVKRSRKERKRVTHADEPAAAASAGTAEARALRDKGTLTRGSCAPQQQHNKSEQDSVHDWIDTIFIPAVNRAGQDGWDILRVAHSIKDNAQKQGDQSSVAAADAILEQFNNSGYPWFRLHPKGRGVVVARQQGIPAFTFVEEYFGELHTGWRWFEIQDAIKKITQKDLPDFYNILLERPRDDPDGYDLTFVDAAFMGSFASRMSHSCTPNCQAVVVSCGGQLTVALYTIRDITPGEELTFDYSSVTESEDEFKQAYCMCSTRNCRGSYLYYTGSKAYMQVIESHHTFLDRQVLLLRCCTESLTQADLTRLDRAGLRGSALGRDDVECNPAVPAWLKKWAALTLEFVEQERKLLPGELQALPPPLTQTKADSIAAAVGVELNRLQNIVISLDKAKYCLNQPGQCKEAPLLLLSDDEVAEYLWNGERSVAKRAVRAAAATMLPAQEASLVMGANTAYDFSQLAQHFEDEHALVAAVLAELGQSVQGAADARRSLNSLILRLRELDVAAGGGHTRAADVLQLYAATQVWFAANRHYISFTSPPLQLHEDMISMHGGLDTSTTQHKKDSTVRKSSSGTTLATQRNGTVASDTGGRAAAVAPAAGDGSDVQQCSDDEYDPDVDSDCDDAVGSSKGAKYRGGRGGSSSRGRGRGRWGGGGRGGGPAMKPLKGISSKVLEKRYGPHYVWAQLSSWYKQTVYDPTASLSADRRGTLSLPDVEGCYASKDTYDTRERQKLIRHIAEQPERQWTSSAWSFRNDAKVYGSPMFDALWGEVMDGVDRYTALEDLAHTLQTAELPVALGGDGVSRSKKGSKIASGRGGVKGGKSSGAVSGGAVYSSADGGDAQGLENAGVAVADGMQLAIGVGAEAVKYVSTSIAAGGAANGITVAVAGADAGRVSAVGFELAVVVNPAS